jgi:probable F420-dependent oxidoreductase
MAGGDDVQTRVRLAVGMPQTFPAEDGIDTGQLRAFLARAEDLGFESAWVVEQILGTIGSLEPIELLTYAAAVTARIRLGTAVLLTPLRSPVHLAKSLATLDHLSHGRLLVGVGLGGNAQLYPAYGITAERRVARFTEGLEVIRRLWTEERVTFAGRFWTLDNVAQAPKPLQKPHPPLWVGAHHPQALRRAVTLGASFMGAGSASTATFAEEVRTLQGLCREAGRDPASLVIGKRVYLAIDRDPDRAGRRLADWFGAFYGRPQLAAQVSVFGDVDACVRGLRAVLDAGAALLMLHPVFDELEHLEAIAAELAPRL